MTDALALPAVTDKDAAHSLGLRKTSNLLALCVASYREGDIDTAFDLFLSGMQSHLNDVESANVDVDPRAFGEIIESALNRANAAALEEETVTEEQADDDILDLAALTDEDLEINDVLVKETTEAETSINNRLNALAALSAL